MATVSTKRPRPIEYPTSDGKPMAETDCHRDLMTDLIATLKDWFAGKPKAYVSGTLMMYYEEGNKRKHVSPDVFVVLGVSKKKRDYYLVWEEGKTPDLAIELTSKSTRREDKTKKFDLYRDVLKVKEYFLFDPYGDYLKPRLQGYSLRNGVYVPMARADGRIASQVIGLHFEPSGRELRLYDPETGQWLPTLKESRDQEAVNANEAKAELQAKARADNAMARVAELEAEKARLAEENERQRQLLEKFLREKRNGH